MTEDFATAALLVVAMVVFNNYRQGKLGDWLKAKFLNDAAPPPAPAGVEGDSGFGSGGAAGEGAGGGGGGSWGGGTTQTKPTGLGGPDGVMVWPVQGTLTGRFGDPRPGHKHEGIDIAVPVGTPVHAARAGRVTYAGASSGYGLRIDVDHGGGVTTRYGHLSRLDVGLGDQVAGGGTIARSGNTGESTGPHLHFEVRRNGTAVDPLPLLINNTVYV